MASSTTSIPVSELANLFTTTYCSNASLMIVLYDWVLCFDKEVALVWKAHRKLTAASLLYALTRYLPILGVLCSLATEFRMSQLSCEATAWIVSLTQIGARLTFAAFSAARVYALSGRNIWLSAVVFLLSSFVCGVNLADLFKNQDIEVLPSPLNCSVIDSASEVEAFIFGITSRAAIIVADTLVVIVTWWYTYRLYRMQRRIRTNQGPSIIQIMLYNGSIYFIVLLSLNSLQMILTALTVDQLFYYTSYMVIFLDPITSILVCRFILNLRQVDVETAPESAATFTSDVDFATQPTSTDHGARTTTLPHFLASMAEPTHVSEVESEWEDGIEMVIHTSTTDSYVG